MHIYDKRRFCAILFTLVLLVGGLLAVRFGYVPEIGKFFAAEPGAVGGAATPPARPVAINAEAAQTGATQADAVTAMAPTAPRDPGSSSDLFMKKPAFKDLVGYYLYGGGDTLKDVAGYTNWALIAPITVERARVVAQDAKRLGIWITYAPYVGDLDGSHPELWDASWGKFEPVADEFRKAGVLYAYFVADEPMANGMSYGELARRIEMVKAAGYPTMINEECTGVVKYAHPPVDYYSMDCYWQSPDGLAWIASVLKAHPEVGMYVAYSFHGPPNDPFWIHEMPDQYAQAKVAKDANIGLAWFTWINWDAGVYHYTGVSGEPATQLVHHQISNTLLTSTPTATINSIPATLDNQPLGTISGSASDVVAMQKMRVVIRYKAKPDGTCTPSESLDWNGTAWVPGCLLENQIVPDYTPGTSIAWSSSSTPPLDKMMPGPYAIFAAAYRVNDAYVPGVPLKWSGWTRTDTVFTAPTPTPTVSIPPSSQPNAPGDANGDGHVNILDFNIVISHFGETGAAVMGDVNGDGVVNILDFGMVVSHFGS